MLPSIIQSKYEQAKGSFDRSDFKTAVEGFTEVLMALSDLDVAEPARQPPLSDLRVLAIGFKDLAVSAMTLRVAPAPAPTPAPPVPEAPGVAAPKIPRIYDSNDPDVVAPATLKQELPSFQRPVLVERRGVLFIVIDETGTVESAIITEPLDRTYDQMILAVAKTWTYRPATRNGVAVKYRKRIQLTLPRQTSP